MSGTPEDTSQPANTPGDEHDGRWQGHALEIDDDAEPQRGASGNGAVGRPGTQSGEETIERPVADFLKHARPAWGRWLGRWLLLAGSVAAALAVAAVVCALLRGARPSGWHGPVLAFEVSILVFVVRAVLAAGVRPGLVCRRVFSLFGLAVSAAVLVGALLRSASGVVYGAPAPELTDEFLVFSLLGLSGCIVHIESLRGTGWACRSAVLAMAVFAALLACQPFLGYGLIASAAVSRVLAAGSRWPVLAALGVCGAGLVAAWELGRKQDASGRKHWGFAVVWAALLLTVAAFRAYQTAAGLGLAAAAAELWVLSALWGAAALLAVLLPGVLASWRSRTPMHTDLRAAARFAWTLMPLSGLACLALAGVLYARGEQEGALVVASAVFAALLGTWLARRQDAWAARWALLPVAGLAVGCLGSFGALVDLTAALGGGRAEVWSLGVTFLWANLATGLSLSAFGVLVIRRDYRLQHPLDARKEDLHLLTTAGWMLTAFLLAVCLAMLAGRPEAMGGLREALDAVGGALRDMLRLGVSRWAIQPVISASGRLHDLVATRAGLAVASVSLAFLLGVHLLAAARVRAAVLLIAAMWAVVGAVLAAFCLLFASRLFVPLQAADVQAPSAAFLQEHFAAKLLVLAMLTALLTRIGESVRSAIAVWRAPERGLGAGAVRRGADPHLTFLVGLGVLVSAAGLGTALLLNLSPPVEAALFELSALGKAAALSAWAVILRLGAARGGWIGCSLALAVVAYMLLALHDDARRGRPIAYALVAFLWLGLLVPFALGWVRELRATLSPPAPGRMIAMGATAVLLVALATAALVMVSRWWGLRGLGTGGALPERDPWPCGPAQGLGTVGTAAALLACIGVAHAALAADPVYADWLRRGLAGGWALLQSLAEAALSVPQKLGLSVPTAATVLGAASAALLLLHVLARYRIAWVRRVLYGIWLLAALGGAGAIAYMAMHIPLGTWSSEQVMGGLLLAALVVRAAAALARPGSWLGGGEVGQAATPV